MKARRKYRHRAIIQFYRDGRQERANLMREQLQALGRKVKRFNRGNESYGRFKVVAHTHSPIPPSIPAIYQAEIYEDSAWTR